MSDGIGPATSARARRGRSAATTALRASADDFLGGRDFTAPQALKAAAAPPPDVEPGGWVTDAKGEERYDKPASDPLAEHQHAAAEREAQQAAANPVPLMRPGELDDALAGGGKPGAPDLPIAYARIVRTTFTFDPDKRFDVLNARLTFKKPAHLMKYAELAQELDDAAGLHRDAAQLFAHAQVTLSQFEADCEVMQGDMRAQAGAQLRAEKEAKGGKQITDGDVTARMATLFPKEYGRQERLKAQAKATKGVIENLVKAWEMRRREIQTLLQECRSAP